MDNMVKTDVIGGMQGAYSMPGLGLCPLNELWHEAQGRAEQ